MRQIWRNLAIPIFLLAWPVVGQQDTHQEKRVSFGKVFQERQTDDSVIIQLNSDEVLVFDSPGPFTLFNPVKLRPRRLVIIAKHAIVEAKTTIRSFDPDDLAQRPEQVPGFNTSASQGMDGGQASNCNQGPDGGPGSTGTDGNTGTQGFRANLIIIDIQLLEGSQPLVIENVGSTGGQGQKGQRGGNGGKAGRGGDGVDHALDCACGGGPAGHPGLAGEGGMGGMGGTGGTGGTILLASTLLPLQTSGMVQTNVSGGRGGEPGDGGEGGLGGQGNQGGSGTSHCDGGSGMGKAPDRNTEVRGNKGKGAQGVAGIVNPLGKSVWMAAPGNHPATH